MPKYKCHKEVWALKINSVEDLPNPDTSGTSGAASHGAILNVEEGFAPIHVDGAFVAKHSPHAGGYFVVYQDGYKSFSPAEAFESGYAPSN
jgi:hypothetical protein